MKFSDIIIIIAIAIWGIASLSYILSPKKKHHCGCCENCKKLCKNQNKAQD